MPYDDVMMMVMIISENMYETIKPAIKLQKKDAYFCCTKTDPIQVIKLQIMQKYSGQSLTQYN